jgi:hypothetical protein
MKPPTSSAATASALLSIPHRPSEFAKATRARPATTTAELSMSARKFRASASSARLRYFWAARNSTRERQRSTAMLVAMTPNAQKEASTVTSS